MGLSLAGCMREPGGSSFRADDRVEELAPRWQQRSDRHNKGVFCLYPGQVSQTLPGADVVLMPPACRKAGSVWIGAVATTDAALCVTSKQPRRRCRLPFFVTIAALCRLRCKT
jgi:hypothetical protein